MKVLILEDNISQVWEYEMILEELGIENVQTFKNANNKLLSSLDKELFDLMIIDIYLSSESNGLAFIEKIKHLNIPFIICTGYPKEKYLDKAFEFGAVGFFTKPLDKAAFTYFLRNFHQKLEQSKSNSDFLTVKDGRKIRKLVQKEIIYILVEGNYCSIMLKGRKITVKKSLKYLMQKLNKDIFVRSHRSVLVNLKEIESIDASENLVQLFSGENLPIGLAYKNRLKLSFMREQ